MKQILFLIAVFFLNSAAQETLANADLLKDFHIVQQLGDQSEWRIIIVGGEHANSLESPEERYTESFEYYSRAVKVATTMGEAGDALLLEGYDHTYYPMSQEEFKLRFHNPPFKKALKYLNSGVLIGGWDDTDLTDKSFDLHVQAVENQEEGKRKLATRQNIAFVLLAEYRDVGLVDSAINALNKKNRVFIEAGAAHATNSALLAHLKKSKIPHLVVSTVDLPIRTTEELAKAYIGRHDLSLDDVTKIMSEFREMPLDDLMKTLIPQP